MPSPLGHALSGLAIAWAVDALSPPRGVSGEQLTIRSRDVAIAAALAAMLPDADLFLASHRGWTHSIGAAAIAAAAAAIWARRRAFPMLATGVAVGLACATHALFDWLGTDGSMPRGVMALWPFDMTYYFSPVAIFPRVERRYWLGWEFVRANIIAGVFEIVFLGGAAYVVWRWRTVRRAVRASIGAPSHARQ
jgi:inner membrane protein